MSVMAVVLAAGAGTRFGTQPKLLAPYGSTTVLGSSLGAAVRAALDETVVVLGGPLLPPPTPTPAPPAEGRGRSGDDDHLGAVPALGPWAAVVPVGVTVLVNPHPGDGLASSLSVALTHARRQGHAAVVVGLGDQPRLQAEAWSRVAVAVTSDQSSPDRNAGRPIVFARYGPRTGHPVGLAAPVWSLLPTRGPHGAGAVARLRPDLVGEVPCPGNPVDIDTPADLARWSPDRPGRDEGEDTWS